MRISAMALPALRGTLRGVVFDMDGTLTIPVIDFPALYRAVLGSRHQPSSDKAIDILHEIEQWSPEEQQRAYATIAEYEKEGLDKLQFMPGAKELCDFIDEKKLKRGLITRNVKAAVDYFHARFEKPHFSPALSREFRPYKPNPAPLLHICSAWGVSPHEVLMVGDHPKDDIVCGNKAGTATCLLDQDDKYIVSHLSLLQRPTFKVRSLAEVLTLLQEKFDLKSGPETETTTTP
ncbi:haloacid dehalogenase-like hydrolase domain-containing protein At2g33255 [Selaginella moellendorffii]|nr:haloacid dehalogenase-like hydrolase domain-containing protein At2g33255 [Selaginella moellendorffii]XP_024539349.1 haloacid dehalogenase-like hydrolase domain-containing protein At2g33255 [Selaginella moellendorffii]|eukprot:XP_002978825.2 haloacid dehalogenase-like hydrolase domain-containing protein At2g33255 [Selaginella moellendorffii]